MLSRRSSSASRQASRKLARDVAKEVDRRQQQRRWRRRAALAGATVTAIILALLFLRFGQGFGLPGVRGSISRRCRVRVSSSGITVDGQPMTQTETVLACRAANGADVIVTGDARQGDWDALLRAFVAAHVPVFIH